MVTKLEDKIMETKKTHGFAPIVAGIAWYGVFFISGYFLDAFNEKTTTLQTISMYAINFATAKSILYIDCHYDTLIRYIDKFRKNKS